MSFTRLGRGATTWLFLGLLIRSHLKLDRAYYGWMMIEVYEGFEVKIPIGDLLRIFELQQDMTSIKQGDCTITDYFTKLRIIEHVESMGIIVIDDH